MSKDIPIRFVSFNTEVEKGANDTLRSREPVAMDPRTARMAAELRLGRRFDMKTGAVVSGCQGNNKHERWYVIQRCIIVTYQ
eukprot:1356070-Amorphochlora_amoeboformis.AAC.2